MTQKLIWRRFPFFSFLSDNAVPRFAECCTMEGTSFAA
jgi:hypothetical protein